MNRTRNSNSALRVLTFNIWGLPDIITKAIYGQLYRDVGHYQSKSARMANICTIMHDYDILLFQEAWGEDDRNLLRDYGRDNGLPYSHYYRSHAQGSGLFLISRYAIEDVHFQPFSLNGTPLNVHHGDWYVGKGMAMAIMRVPVAAAAGVATAANERRVTVYFTHTIAEYELPPNDIYKGHRCSQLWEALKFIRISHMRNRDPQRLTLFVGDFNCLPDSVEHRLLIEYGRLVDCFSAFRTMCRTPGADATLDDGDDLGHTIIDVTVDNKPKRLDYVMMMNEPGVESPWRIERVHVTAKSGAGAERRIFSDHSAVAAYFVFDPQQQLSARAPTPVEATTVGDFLTSDDYDSEQCASVAAHDTLREVLHEIRRSELLLAARERFHLIMVLLSLTFVSVIFAMKACGVSVPGLPLLLIDFIEGVVLLYGCLVLVLYVYWRIESNGLRKVKDEMMFYVRPGAHRDLFR